MRIIIPTLIILISCSTKNQTKVNSEQDDTVKLTKVDLQSVKSDKREDESTTTLELDSVSCNQNALLAIHNNFDNLNKEDIANFLMTFHEDCRNNIEFSQWSNELLYKTLDSYTKEVMDLLIKPSSNFNRKVILSELESPINDAIMPQPIIDKINEMDYNNASAKSVIAALQTAADKY